MANLPPFDDDVRDVPSALAAIRARVAKGWDLDPRDGCHEGLWLEFSTARESALFLLGIALWIAALVTVFFTRGPAFLGLLGAAVVLSVVLKIISGRNCARIRRLRREAVVVPACWTQANRKLLEPGAETSYADFVFAVSGPARDDPAVLLKIARRISDEIRGRESVGTADEKAILAHLNGSFEQRSAVPESWCGVPGVEIAGVKIDPAWLPGRVLTNGVHMLLAHPASAFDSVWYLPRRFWGREDVDALLQPILPDDAE